MAEIQRGEGKKFGIVAVVTAVATGGAAAAGGQTTSGMGKANIIDYSFGFTGETILGKSGADGEFKSRIDHAHAQTCSLTVEFYDTTIALANAAFLVPSRGMSLTITDASDPQLAGDWIVDASEKKATVDGIGTATIGLWRDAAKVLSPVSAIIV